MSQSQHRDPSYVAPERSLHVTSRLMGVVRDLSGNPLPGAEVTLLPQDVTALAAPDGTFAFLLPAGRVTLHVAARGHVPVVVERIDLVPGGSWRRDVVLATVPAPMASTAWQRQGHRASRW